jgi:hypothetical protein
MARALELWNPQCWAGVSSVFHNNPRWHATGYESYYPSLMGCLGKADNLHHSCGDQRPSNFGEQALYSAPSSLALRHFNPPNINSGSDGHNFEHRINRRSMASGLDNHTQGWPSSNNVAQHQGSTQAAASQLEAREGPTPSQWQAVREEIILLYEKSPLRDVRSIMERRGFRA